MLYEKEKYLVKYSTLLNFKNVNTEFELNFNPFKYFHLIIFVTLSHL